MSNLRSALQTVGPVVNESVSSVGVTSQHASDPQVTGERQPAAMQDAVASTHTQPCPELSPGSHTDFKSTSSRPTQVAAKTETLRKTSLRRKNSEKSEAKSDFQTSTAEISITKQPYRNRSESKGSRAPTGECYNCRKPGHIASRCPDKTVGRKSPKHSNDKQVESLVRTVEELQGQIDSNLEQAKIPTEIFEDLVAYVDARIPDPPPPAPPKIIHEHSSSFSDAWEEHYDSTFDAVDRAFIQIDNNIDYELYSALRRDMVYAPVCLAVQLSFALIAWMILLMFSSEFTQTLNPFCVLWSPLAIVVAAAFQVGQFQYRAIFRRIKLGFPFIKLKYNLYMIDLYKRKTDQRLTLKTAKLPNDASYFKTCGLDMRHDTNALMEVKYKMSPMVVLLLPTMITSDNKWSSFIEYIASPFRNSKYMVDWVNAVGGRDKPNKGTSAKVICGELFVQLMNSKNAVLGDSAKQIYQRMHYSSDATHKVNIDRYFSTAHGNVYHNTVQMAAYLQRQRNLIDSRQFPDFCGTPSDF